MMLVNFCATTVSVKSKRITCIKPESLFFGARRRYKSSVINIGAFAFAGLRNRWKPKMQAFNAQAINAQAPQTQTPQTQASKTNIRNRVLALVTSILEQNAIAAQVHPDSRLVDVGLTSMDMVNLMLGVEAEFDFTIPQALITPENFQSIESLELMITGQLQAERAA
jgi:acyl carrier protein